MLFGGTIAHPLGTDELGRDVFSRLIMSIRMSLLIALFGTLIAATLGTALGILAAHFRRYVETVILMAIDFQASMPFMIIALSVLAFFGNTLPLFIGLMGFHSWERYARITRGLTLAANEQGYASAVRQLGAGPGRIYGLHILPNIASTLIVSMTLTFPEIILLESGLSFLGSGRAAAADLARQHGGLWPRVHHPRALDHAGAGHGDRADHALDQPFRRLAARQARSDAALTGARASGPLIVFRTACVLARLMIMSARGRARSGRP